MIMETFTGQGLMLRGEPDWIKKLNIYVLVVTPLQLLGNTQSANHMERLVCYNDSGSFNILVIVESNGELS